ncbi:MAG: hypothetical protein HKM05_09805 [Spirochaetales bacterium]|nr:hypothetical protein [Spirochaetales bacterium]
MLLNEMLNENLPLKLKSLGPRVAILLAIVSTFVLALGLQAPNEGDVAWYQWMIHDWAAGHLPYLSHPVEYPPYALGIFLLPWLMGDSGYLINFMILALGLDVLVKLFLGWPRYRALYLDEQSWRAWVPLILYSLAELFLGYFMLQRYDIWPMLLSVAGLFLAYQKRWFVAGLLLALGIGAKLYPLLFVLPLAAWAYQNGAKAVKSYFLGGIAGLLPLVVISFLVPWWNFLLIQGGRGLQVESLAASLLWVGHLWWGASAVWVRSTAWYEIQGPIALAAVPWVKGLFGGTVLLSVAVSTVAVWQKKLGLSLPRLANLLLLPLTAFVIFNPVFSPQYMIWIIPFAAIAVLDTTWWPAVCLLVACVFVPSIYPVPDYFTGLQGLHCAALVTRNLLVLASWLGLAILGGTGLRLRIA